MGPQTLIADRAGERADAFLAHILDVTAGTVEGMVCGERFQDVPWRPPVRGEGGPHG